LDHPCKAFAIIILIIIGGISGGKVFKNKFSMGLEWIRRHKIVLVWAS
jgi:hypothetical protein